MSMQSKIVNGELCKDPNQWFQSHESDYAETKNRLSQVRGLLLNGDLSKGTEILKKAYMNAMLSIQTPLSRHEKAYAKWAYGDITAKEALLLTVYGGTKINQWKVLDQLNNEDWEKLLIQVRLHVQNGDLCELLDVSNTVSGVGFRKWSFVLAMSGIWELACIDSNVSRNCGIDVTGNFNDNPREYLDILDELTDMIDQHVKPFIAQWAIYDFERGEHARHMIFFNSVLD